MFLMRTLWCRCNWKLLCSSHLYIRVQYPVHPNPVHDRSVPLFHSGCILSCFYDGNFGLVQNECCHFTTEYCKKGRKPHLIDWGWRKINVLYSSMTSPSLSRVMYLPTFFQQSASLLWIGPLIVHRSSRSQLFSISLL